MTDEPGILIVNKSALVSAGDIVSMVAAINKHVQNELAPFWGVSRTIYFGDAPEGSWIVVLQDTIDDPEALAYHVDTNNVVSAISDVKSAKDSGTDWRLPVCHEIDEMLVDPTCIFMGTGAFSQYIRESVDPVEEQFHPIDGVPVCNFVTPAYFGFNASTQYDFQKELSGPCPILAPGGYQEERLADGSWTSHWGDRRGFMASRPNGRRAYRRKNSI